jgi:hypothetical protein
MILFIGQIHTPVLYFKVAGILGYMLPASFPEGMGTINIL